MNYGGLNRSPDHRLNSVPRLFSQSLYLILTVAACLGVANWGQYSLVQTNNALDVWFIGVGVWLAVTSDQKKSLSFAFLVIFAFSKIAGFFITGTAFFDAVQAYKWILYLMIFSLSRNVKLTSDLFVKRIFWTLQIAALFKYLGSWVVNGPSSRPGLLAENNFELALFCGLGALVVSKDRRSRWGVLLALAVTTALSGSRSGAVEYLVLVLLIVYMSTSKTRLRVYLTFLSIAGLVLLDILVFEVRSNGTFSIDRVHFLSVFLHETSKWDWTSWIFGTLPLTHISASGCGELHFYQLLFSSDRDGSCYSVILHLFELRVVFDAGLLGLVVSIVMPLASMFRAAVPTKGLPIALIGIAVANGLSVSGINNPFVALTICLSIWSQSERARPEEVLIASTVTRTNMVP